MSDIGKIGWIDLTSENADQLRTFYSAVTGLKTEEVDVGDYVDFNLCRPDGEAVAGICHKKGVNKSIPKGWLIYIVVENLDESLKKCESEGGKILKPAASAGPSGRLAILQDPDGSAFALFEQSV